MLSEPVIWSLQFRGLALAFGAARRKVGYIAPSGGGSVIP